MSFIKLPAWACRWPRLEIATVRGIQNPARDLAIMGTKRAFADVDSHEADDCRGDPSSSHNTKRPRQLGKAKHKAKQGTSEFSKKRARDVQRLLQRKQDLPANVVNDLERELAAHKADLADKAFQRKRSAMIAKYHMVRFFGTSSDAFLPGRWLMKPPCSERRKASRLVKQLGRQIEQNPDSDEMDRLKKELHIAAVDEAYTLYFPHLEPYVSLYGGVHAGEADEGEGKVPSAKESLKSQRPPMWSVVERTMAAGPEALRRLQETRSADGNLVGKMPKRQRPKGPVTSTKIMEPTPVAPPQQKRQEKKGPSKKDGEGVISSVKEGAASQLNRRERRRLMHQAKAAADDEQDEEGGGFFEGL